MSSLVSQYWLHGLLFLALAGAGLGVFLNQKNIPNWNATTVSRGTVQELVSVSGFTEAKNTAHLSFPTSGVVTGVFVDEGSTVTAGELLATLGSASLITEREQAVAALEGTLAVRDELIAGPTRESRAVTDATVTQAKTALQQTLQTELEKVRNAELALRSNNLTAYAVDSEEDATAPRVSGTYTCEEEGVYQIELYRSDAQSGYSFRYTGLESGTETATIDQPALFGDCGLSLQFTEDSGYANSEWTIAIPNTRSATYVTYKNAYNLALAQAEQNIAAAEEALALATDQANVANAAPRVEALMQANAEVQQAQARVATIDAQLADRSMTAPFAGTVTEVAIVPGEVARATPIITLLSEDAFEVRARVPEIDITKVAPGQTVSVVFDAKQDAVLAGTVSFVSPLPEEIDGVAYFETLITLEEVPSWLKAGLNGDVDITIQSATDVLRVPQRYLTQTTDGYTAQILEEDTVATTSVDVGLVGNDGFVEVTNVAEGTTLIAP